MSQSLTKEFQINQLVESSYNFHVIPPHTLGYVVSKTKNSVSIAWDLPGCPYPCGLDADEILQLPFEQQPLIWEFSTQEYEWLT